MKSKTNPMERGFQIFFLCCGILSVAFVLCISIYLIVSGLPAIIKIGPLKFLFGQKWSAGTEQFGILSFILTSVYGTAGAVVLAKEGPGPYITHVTVGKINDKGIRDANNMGAAMTWAAYDTISCHLRDTGRAPAYYDLIVTGDLGKLGRSLLVELFQRDGVELSGNYNDCGCLLYDFDAQDVHCGGSGCGCSACVLTGYLLNGMRAGKWNRLLFCATGALHSPTAVGQGESIPGICHAVSICNSREG
ncbi:MAG: hypothetical protein LUG65_05820 [Clostridiales bacterium]|nr:hypothetical protein [Clostridiales bacterium]